MRRALESEHIDYVDDARPDLRVVVEGDCSTRSNCGHPGSEMTIVSSRMCDASRKRRLNLMPFGGAVFAWAVAEPHAFGRFAGHQRQIELPLWRLDSIAREHFETASGEEEAHHPVSGPKLSYRSALCKLQQLLEFEGPAPRS
jgi:hypothetical protein